MNALSHSLLIRTPSRLHFGLLASGPGADRRFGGVGLMVERPGLRVSARPSAGWRAEGPLAGRVLAFAERAASRLEGQGARPPRAAFRVESAPGEHLGLGTGTQLGLAVARLLAELAGLGDLPAESLARLAGRGLRSGVGLHGFARGGLVVDGGHRRGSEDPPPLVARLDWPEDWRVLVLLPDTPAGLHGDAEARAFAGLPAIPEAVTDRLCRLVLMGLLPAAAEADLEAFGEALEELQRRVGEQFRPAQGGLFASPSHEALAARLRAEGLRGVGQSSWGPALYGILRDDDDRRHAILRRLTEATEAGSLPAFRAIWTEASRRGAEVRHCGEDGA